MKRVLIADENQWCSKLPATLDRSARVGRMRQNGNARRTGIRRKLCEANEWNRFCDAEAHVAPEQIPSVAA